MNKLGFSPQSWAEESFKRFEMILGLPRGQLPSVVLGESASFPHHLADFMDDSAVAKAHDDRGDDQDDQEQVDLHGSPQHGIVNAANAPIPLSSSAHFQMDLCRRVF